MIKADIRKIKDTCFDHVVPPLSSAVFTLTVTERETSRHSKTQPYSVVVERVDLKKIVTRVDDVTASSLKDVILSLKESFSIPDSRTYIKAPEAC